MCSISEAHTTLVCNVTNAVGPQKNKPCVFPFTMSNDYETITYTKCTTVLDPEDKPWCSTKVDYNGQHIGAHDNWGFCDERCKFGETIFGNKSCDLLHKIPL